VVKKRPPSAVDHQELWRPEPDFVGPLMPPMLLWVARGRPKSPWALQAEAREDHLPMVVK
jgi:hypothetical protein